MTATETTDTGFSALLLTTGADDRDGILTLLSGMCRNLVVTGTPDEATARLREAAIDVAVVAHYPDSGSNGFLLAAALRESCPGLQVIVIGGQRDLASLEAAMDAGVTEYCPLPVDRDRLAVALSRCRRETACRNNFSCRRFLTVNSDPFNAVLHVDSDGTIRQSGDVIRRLAPCVSGEKQFSFTLFASEAFADRRQSRVTDLIESAAACRGWRGELYGAGSNNRNVYDVTLIPCPPGHGFGVCGVTIRDVSDYAVTIDRCTLQKNEALDLLRLSAGSAVAVGETSKPEIIRLQALVTTGFSACSNVSVTCELASQLPECFRSPDVSLVDIFAGLGRHVNGMQPVKGIAFKGVLKEQAGERFTLACTLSVKLSNVTVNRFFSAADYLAIVEQGQLDGVKPQGIGLAITRLSQLDSALTVKIIAGEGVSFSFLLYLRASESCSAAHAVVQEPPGAIGVSFWNRDASTVSAPHSGPLRVLVTDDSFIDQMSLKNLLEKAGCEVVTASNGREAVEEFDSGDYDLVLMDILMPVMDGFEATRVIREQERPSGKRTPVMALTSYSLKAVNDKCISVGMDGYMSKPVKQVDITALLGRLTSARIPEAEPLAVQATVDTLPVLDVAGTVQNLGDDMALYKSIAMLFDEQTGPMLTSLVHALDSGEIQEIGRAAHKLKGTVLALGGRRLADSLLRLEEMARNGQVDDGATWKQLVGGEYELLKAAMSRFCQDGTTS